MPSNPWQLLATQQPRPAPVSEVALAAVGGSGSSGATNSSTGQAALCSDGGGRGAFAVPRIPMSEMTYDRFCLEFMEPNLPVVIQGATKGWAAARDWVTPSGAVDLDFLQRHFGSAQIVATDTAKEHEGCGPCQQMSLAEYIGWWRQQQQQQQQQQQGEQPLQKEQQHAERQQEGPHEQNVGQQPQRQQQQQPSSTPLRPPPPQGAQLGVNAQSEAPDAAAEAAATSSGGAVTATVTAAASPAAGPSAWYCKDWHAHSEFPQYQAYSCPAFFQDDWLNEYYDATHGQHAQQGQQAQQQDGSLQLQQHLQRGQQGQEEGEEGVPRAEGRQQQEPPQQQQGALTTSDYRFTYMGPRGTCTALHSDVLRSHSWSANVAGRKLWRLLPPRHSHLLLDRLGRGTPWDFSAADPEGLYPGLPEARRHLLTVEQQPGDAIFVPSGWFHTVENLDDCASINHNWFNGHNIHWVWALLRQEHAAAEAGIEDCRELCSPVEFEGLVQRNLGANAGMDYSGFGALLRCIAGASLRRLSMLLPADAPAGAAKCAAASGGSSSLPARGGHAGAAAGAEAGLGGAAEAAEATAEAAATGVQHPSGKWYHAFRLLRVALVLRELLAAQEQIDDACRKQQQRQLGKEEQQAEQAEQQGPPPAEPQAAGVLRAGQQAAAGGGVGAGAVRETQPHAEEVAANRVCLASIEQQLCMLGIELSGCHQLTCCSDSTCCER